MSSLHKSSDHLTPKQVYTSEDLKGISDIDSLPGESPYLRGPYPNMYAGRPWTLRQYAGFSTAKDSNIFFKKTLQNGGQGLSVAFDLATHRGYDSDHPRVQGDVGRAGVAIDSVEDMKELFKGIPLEEVSVSMTMNGAVLPILAAYLVTAEEQGANIEKLKGTIQNDILKEFMVRNTYIYPPQPSMRIVKDILVFCSKSMPFFNPISISGYHMQEAGAYTALELAYTLKDGEEYIKTALSAGLNIDEFAPRLSFFFGTSMNFYQEIAKLRAARKIWHKLVNQFNPKNKKSTILKTHCQTSGWSLTAQDPYNNIIRTTIEAMAAVFGGTQSLHTNALDEAVALPSEFSARIARNTQLILQEETGLTDVADPWGGSYMMERLTEDLIQQTEQLMHEIDQEGGMAVAIEKGIPKQKIEEAALRKQAKLDSGEDTLIGVNKYKLDQEDKLETLEVDNSQVLKTQAFKLKALKKQRNNNEVKSKLILLEEAAADENQNLLNICIQAIKARATIGEVSQALENKFGRYEAEVGISKGVYKASFDKEWTESKALTDFKDLMKDSPKLLLAKLGQDGHDRGYKTIAGALSDLGFEVELAPLFSTPLEIAQLAIDKKVNMVGISTLVAAHKSLIPELLEHLKDFGGTILPVFVGGVMPESDVQKLKDLGVVSLYGPGTPIPDIAEDILKQYLKHRD